MEVGHDSWLTETGYVVLFWGEALRDLYSSSVKDFCWPTEDVSVNLYWWGFFFFFALACPTRRILFFAPEWESVNGIWRVRRSIEQVVQSFVSWVGDVGVVFPSPLGICGQRGIQLIAITSPQPRLSGNLLFSLFLSVLLLFPCLPHSRHLTRLMLSLIQFLLSYLFPPPPPLHYICILPLWCEMNWEETQHHFLFVICDCGAVCLSRKQFHKKLSAFIQFSKKKGKKRMPVVIIMFCICVICEHACGCTCIYMRPFFPPRTYLIV